MKITPFKKIALEIALAANEGGEGEPLTDTSLARKWSDGKFDHGDSRRTFGLRVAALRTLESLANAGLIELWINKYRQECYDITPDGKTALAEYNKRWPKSFPHRDEPATEPIWARRQGEEPRLLGHLGSEIKAGFRLNDPVNVIVGGGGGRKSMRSQEDGDQVTFTNV